MAPAEPVAEPDPRTRLLLAAEEVFADRGYDGATVRAIVEHAGMNVAAINYHFGDKERLYVEVVKHAHACTVGDEVGGEFPAGAAGPPRERLRHIVGHMARQMVRPARPTAVKLLMREFAQPSAVTREVVEAFIRPVMVQLKSALAEITPGWTESAHLLYVWSVVGQCLFYRQNRVVLELLHGRETMEALDPRAVADHVARLVLAGIDADLAASPARPTTRKKRTP